MYLRFEKKNYLWTITTSVNVCFQDPNLLPHLVKGMGKVVAEEVKALCFHSALNTASCISLSVKDVIHILETQAPCLSTILKACITNEEHNYAFVSAMGVLMKGQWNHACIIQRMVSLILYMGHASKKVSVCNYSQFLT